MNAYSRLAKLAAQLLFLLAVFFTVFFAALFFLAAFFLGAFASAGSCTATKDASSVCPQWVWRTV